jgi:hypothetical protein
MNDSKNDGSPIFSKPLIDPLYPINNNPMTSAYAHHEKPTRRPRDKDPFHAAHRHEKVTHLQDHGLLVERPSGFLPRTEMGETLRGGINSVQRDPSRGEGSLS